MGVEHDDALITDVVDDQVREFVLLLEKLLGLGRLLHSLEQADEKERRAHRNADDEGEALENVA
jgi:hypothetical protein